MNESMNHALSTVHEFHARIIRSIGFSPVASLLVLTLTATILPTSSALAFLDGELAVGSRSGSWEPSSQSGKSLSSTSIQMAAHLDPIPLVPVSFGLRFISESYQSSVADHGVKSLSSTAIVPEITAWLPLGDLKPFGRLGYTALSAYKGTAEQRVNGVTSSGSVVYKSSGPRAAIGLELSLLPLVSLTAALEYSTETISMTEGKIGSVDLTTNAKEIKFTSNAILVGAKVGL